MTPTYQNPERGVSMYLGDCLEIMRGLADNSVDAVICDPPYELGFMGRKWDRSGIAYNVEMWREVLRVAKPGTYLLAFGGTRTYHRMACAIEDAGWEIRDCLMWLYGSGFPKSLDISKAIDKAAGAEREVVGKAPHGACNKQGGTIYSDDNYEWTRHYDITIPTSPAAKLWQGWGTALKPAYEPIILARKPLDGNVASNVLKHGVGGINVDGCRIGTVADMNPNDFGDTRCTAPKFNGILNGGKNGQYRSRIGTVPDGRWPVNVILDEEAGMLLDRQSGESLSRGGGGLKSAVWEESTEDKKKKDYGDFTGFSDFGGASRFFYCAKASRAEREHGLAHLPRQTREDVTGREPDSAGQNNPRAGTRAQGAIRNIHPTVKPLALMSYLCKLITPPTGVILDPFTGTGSTGCAAASLGFQFIGIEREQEYVDIAVARIEAAILGGVQGELV